MDLSLPDFELRDALQEPDEGGLSFVGCLAGDLGDGEVGEDPSELGSAEVLDDKEGDLAEGSVEMET